MINEKEKEKYLLFEKRDTAILEMIHELEKADLSDYEEFLVSWTRTQLEKDWRKPLLQILELLKENIDKPKEERISILKKFAKDNFWKP
ncbi:MAG: hypothetical protein KJ709_01340 [Nanoarchaeota archaeon]|nr:hypothetical protein [Nanoarchaeota archaeon]